MWWLFNDYSPRYYQEQKIWVKIRFQHETDKAILVYCNNKKIWIPKSRVLKIRLRKGVFEIYTKEALLNNYACY